MLRDIGAILRWHGVQAAVVLGTAMAARGEELPDRYWPAFPTPTRVVVAESHLQPSFAHGVLLQTLAGLVAHQTRERGTGELVWLGTPDNPSYEMWFRRCLRYLRMPCEEQPVPLWDLVTRYRKQGIVKGYVLYREDPSRRRLYTGRPADTSVNVATTLCAQLQGVAVAETLRQEADAHGLPLLMDVRGKDEDWVWKQFGRRFSPVRLALQDPKSTIVRDAAVAMGAMLVTGEGDLYERVLARLQPGSPVLGWGIGLEDALTGPSSRHAALQTATNWCVNLPVLSSGRTGLDYPFVPFRRRPSTTPTQTDEPPDDDQRYVSFILSDGDNVQWLMLNFCLGNEAGQYWACPDRGKMPFGWTIPAMDLLQLCPYTLDYLRETATPNDGFVLLGGGYYYPDWFGTARPEKDLLARHARRMGKYMRRCGLATLLVNAQDWDGPAATQAYQTYAKKIPGLEGIFAIQYAPYTAGQGAIRWVPTRTGRQVPVITARHAVWAHRGQHPVEGPPGKVAHLLNRWADAPARRLEDRFAWVIVHCWSRFRRATPGADWQAEEVPQNQHDPQNAARGYRPAIWCAERLSSRIKLVAPSELLRRLARTADRVP